MPVCPKCGKAAKSVAGLTKHLTGRYQYGGHVMERAGARELAESLASTPAELEAAVRQAE